MNLSDNNTLSSSTEKSIRPKYFREYIGQDLVNEQMSIFVRAALDRKEPLDHLLIIGPPGLGKTTLAIITAHEMGGNIIHTSGPILSKPGDLAAILTNLEKNTKINNTCDIKIIY